jgi:anthranilate phosphoribosyltransferase
VNAAAALIAAGLTQDLRDAIERAIESVDSGAAWQKVERLKSFTTASEPETRN